MSPEFVREMVRCIDRDINDEHERHKRALRALRDQYRLIVRNCLHEKETRHRDPSGNNDSFFSCDACGRERL